MADKPITKAAKLTSNKTAKNSQTTKYDDLIGIGAQFDTDQRMPVDTAQETTTSPQEQQVAQSSTPMLSNRCQSEKRLPLQDWLICQGDKRAFWRSHGG
ncbi:hypothetical protein Slin15195_G058920 [Septoria linicola]|uniref:Uncharacterized protein n=1 Tax=Septoria linicola TaxID=215465 RepID=A0A9Q9AUX1_9PEZI|nr:hypothetical protein Slin14017_G074780 [Septoria linicola]USW52573.1 hypothetical protein Slin15195_G058920 [Septoria linicola]